MSLDMHAFELACRKITGIDSHLLRKAIFGVYGRWEADLKRMPRSEIDFHGYYALSLADLGITDEGIAEPYRKALGTFFNQRALKALRERRGIPPAPKHKVEDASDQEVRIRVVPEISVRFRAQVAHGKLRGFEVHPVRKKVYFGPMESRPPKKAMNEAIRQAVAVMNEKRGFKPKHKKRNR